MAFWVGSLFFGPGSALVHILILVHMHAPRLASILNIRPDQKV